MPLTAQDEQKLSALRRFFVLDHAPSDDEIGRIVHFAGELFGVAFAYLTLRGEDEYERVAAAFGFEASELPADAVMFARGGGASIPVSVADASLDGRFANNPLVQKGARLYAGVPLKSAQGFTLGTLAIMDTESHGLSSEGMTMLANMGALVEPALQLVRSRRELEVAAESIARSKALSAAAVASSEALAAGPAGFGEAMAHIGPSTHCARAALFLHRAGKGGILVANCAAHWTAIDESPISTEGALFDFAAEGLARWTGAFAQRSAVAEEASGPFLQGARARIVAAIPLAHGQTRPGFVLLDRTSAWTEHELLGLQVAFRPLAASLSKPAGEPGIGLLEQCPVAMLGLNGADGRIVFANETARKLFEIDAESIGACSLWEVISTPHANELEAFFAPQRLGGTQSIEIEIQDHVEGHRSIQLTRSPVPFGSGNGWLVACADLTASKEREAALVLERDEANESTRAKSAFLASMSHEIRTALTAILGNAEFLADELADDHLDMARTILGSSERLLQTLNSVMDMERLESAGESPVLQVVSLGEIVRNTARVYEPRAADKNLAFMCEGAEHDHLAWAEPGALTRVLDNLISNALKFTQTGGIRLRISKAPGEVRLEVQDTGIGIEAAFLPFLFERFRQESREPGMETTGSGLGLALTKRLVELMNGQIAVSSRVGKGTVFSVALRSVTARTEGDGIATEFVPAAHA